MSSIIDVTLAQAYYKIELPIVTEWLPNEQLKLQAGDVYLWRMSFY